MRPFLLKPAIKDYIWGGTKLREEFGRKSSKERLAESWELSCHPDGESIIASGEYMGMKLSEFIRLHPEAVGRDFSSDDKFPILVKLIDAKDDLSIQVHPDNEYAAVHENDSGKTEMWYIIEADEGAELVYGFREELTKEQFRNAVENNTIMDKVKRVAVKAGDVFLIQPGTLHAIGKGILLAEIQQSSNVTYRVYDYGRLGIDGKPRELHIEKALDVTNTQPSETYQGFEPFSTHGHIVHHLAKCQYFHVIKFDIFSELQGINGFAHALFIGGNGCVECDEGCIQVSKGSSVFIPHGVKNCKITGKCSVIITTV